MPILSRNFTSTVQSCCLRNSDTWKSLEQYLAEYQLITDRKMMKQLTQAQVFVEAPEHRWPMVEYTHYGYAQVPPRWAYASLLPRKQFTKWFYGLLLRFALPFNQNLLDRMRIVLSSLNMTILFRLIPHLASIGYPPHWMSEILTNIIENKVTTSARPPRKTPMTVVDVKRDHPEKKLCTSHFSNEMATLAQLFQPLLPFQLTSKAVPELKDIYKYTFHLPNYLNLNPYENNLALVFMDSDLFLPIIQSQMQQGLGFELRPFIDPSWGDEVDDKFKGRKQEALREKGLAIWTTLEWDVKAKKASLWLSESFVDSCIKKEWVMGLFRTDIWSHVGVNLHWCKRLCGRRE